MSQLLAGERMMPDSPFVLAARGGWAEAAWYFA